MENYKSQPKSLYTKGKETRNPLIFKYNDY